MNSEPKSSGEESVSDADKTPSGVIPRRLFGRLVSQGERMKLQPDERLGGCWMIRTEYVQKLLEGKLSEVYFTWVPDRPGWKRAD